MCWGTAKGGSGEAEGQTGEAAAAAQRGVVGVQQQMHRRLVAEEERSHGHLNRLVGFLRCVRAEEGDMRGGMRMDAHRCRGREGAIAGRIV